MILIDVNGGQGEAFFEVGNVKIFLLHSIVGRKVDPNELNEHFWFELFVGPAKTDPMFQVCFLKKFSPPNLLTITITFLPECCTVG
jgi:hypothetical protein